MSQRRNKLQKVVNRQDHATLAVSRMPHVAPFLVDRIDDYALIEGLFAVSFQ
jgi:hypothetical protein